MNGIRAFLTVGLTLLSVPALAEGLAVRPGLWESTSSGGAPQGAAPQIPPEALARMTPDQQAILRQRMAGGGAPTAHRYCLTEAMRRKGFTGQNTQPNCTNTVVSISASDVRVSVTCTGAHSASGSVTVHTVGDTGISGSIDMNVGDGHGGSTPMHREFQSHWVGPDCGNVHPAE
jgi:hypothetical protein